MGKLLVALAWGVSGLLASAEAPNFAYDRRVPLEIHVRGEEDHDGVRVKDITFAAALGGRTAAYLVEPLGVGRPPYAGILYVHWYEPREKNSNRTEFLEEAVTMARRGARSLLVSTMWSDPEWFDKRDRKNDFVASIRQVIELRRALDVLAAQPDADHKHIAYVGHDFGAMYGAVLAGLESKRVAAWVLAAGTTSFSDWYLLGKPKLDGPERDNFVERLAPLDPVKVIQFASPVLLQFGKGDPYVPDEKAKTLAAAASEPKQVSWFEGGHALDERAMTQRIEWLTDALRLLRSR
jgi:predicted esterase